MNEKDKQKAREYFIDKHGDRCTTHGHLFSFGYSTLPRLIRYSPHISSSAKICYEAMLDMIHNNNNPMPWTYYPSQKRIGYITGLNRKVVVRSMKELTQHGLIGKKRQGLGKQNIYCLLKPPDIFVKEAIKRRYVLNMISNGKMSWDDINDSGEINNEDIAAEIEAVISSFHQDDNPLTHVTSQMSSNGTSGSPKQGLQEVLGENGHATNGDVPSSDNFERQELTSVDLTSDKVSSNSTPNVEEHTLIENNPGDTATTDTKQQTKAGQQTTDSVDKGTESNKLEEDGRDLDNISLPSADFPSYAKYSATLVEFMRQGCGLPQKVVGGALGDKNNDNEIQKLYESEVPLEVIKDGIKQTLKNGKGKAKSFRYFLPAIQEKLEEYQQRPERIDFVGAVQDLEARYG